MKILVIGDSCKDKYIYGLCDRMCPEAPVPVFQPVKEKSNFNILNKYVIEDKQLSSDFTDFIKKLSALEK